MPKLLIFNESGPNKEHYRDILTRVLVDVLDVSLHDVEMHFWESVAKTKEIITWAGEDVIIICGETALNQMFRVKGIKRHVGRVLDFYDHKVVPLMSPGYIISHPGALQDYAEAVQAAYMVASGEEYEPPCNEHVIIDTVKDLRKYAKFISETSACAFDFETTTLTDMNTFDPNFKLRLLSLTFQQGSSIVINLKVMTPNDVVTVAGILEECLFANTRVIKVAHHAKFDMHCAARMGVKRFLGQFHCTMLMAQLIDENTSNRLKDLVKVYLPAYAGYEDELKGRWEDMELIPLARYSALDSDLTLRLYILFTYILMKHDERIYNLFRNVSVPAMMALFKAEETGMLIDKVYLAQAIKDTEKIIGEQEIKLRGYDKVKMYQAHRDDQAKQTIIVKLEDRIDAEKDKVFILSPSERRDQRVIELIKQMACETDEARKGVLEARLTKERDKVYKGVSSNEARDKRVKVLEDTLNSWRTGKTVATTPINFNSPDQMNELLYEKHGFNFDYTTDPLTGKLRQGTGKDVVAYLSDKSGFIDRLLAYRQLGKILSTYLISIKDKTDASDYIHTTFNQHVTKTGRLSSESPNLQNQITRTKYKLVEEVVKYVKRAFKTPTGYTLIQADYSQAELRLMAHYSQDKAMMKAYKDELDLHELTAAAMKKMTVEKFRELPEKDYKQLRFEAKSQNFGLIYDMSAPGYRDYARVKYGIILSKRKAEQERDAFFEMYPELRKYHRLYKAKAYKYGYVRTMFGRKVRLPDLHSYNRWKVGHAERNAINSPIQGTAGEMTEFAFALLQHILDPRVLFINTIHDSILFYIPDDIFDETVEIIRHVMENLPIDTYFDRELSLPMKADFEKSKVSWGHLEPIV